MRPVLLRSLGIGMVVGSLAVGLPPAASSAAQEAAEATQPAPAADADGNDAAARFAAFTEAMTNVKLVGAFTVDGPEEGKLVRDEYTISSVTKAPKGDLWIVSARIRYGTVDLTVPVPVEVKWAGKTPVITLDAVTIPGLGTFSSRVVIDGTRYAGTWQHDAVGGHMFGKIVPVEAPEKVPATEPGEGR